MLRSLNFASNWVVRIRGIFWWFFVICIIKFFTGMLGQFYFTFWIFSAFIKLKKIFSPKSILVPIKIFFQPFFTQPPWLDIRNLFSCYLLVFEIFKIVFTSLFQMVWVMCVSRAVKLYFTLKVKWSENFLISLKILKNI